MVEGARGQEGRGQVGVWVFVGCLEGDAFRAFAGVDELAAIRIRLENHATLEELPVEPVRVEEWVTDGTGIGCEPETVIDDGWSGQPTVGEVGTGTGLGWSAGRGGFESADEVG